MNTKAKQTDRKPAAKPKTYAPEVMKAMKKIRQAALKEIRQAALKEAGTGEKREAVLCECGHGIECHNNGGGSCTHSECIENTLLVNGETVPELSRCRTWVPRLTTVKQVKREAKRGTKSATVAGLGLLGVAMMKAGLVGAK